MVGYVQVEENPTDFPPVNSLSMDRPTAFLSCSVQRVAIRNGRRRTNSRSTRLWMSTLDRMDAKLKPRPGRAKKTCDLADSTSDPVRYPAYREMVDASGADSVTADGRACSLSTTKRS